MTSQGNTQTIHPAELAAAARAGFIAFHADMADFDAGAAWDDMGGSEASQERTDWEAATYTGLLAAAQVRSLILSLA